MGLVQILISFLEKAIYLVPLATVLLFCLGTRRQLEIPRVGDSPQWSIVWKTTHRWLDHSLEILEDGYSRYKDSLFLVDTMDIPNRVVLSNKYVVDYDHATDSTLSHSAAVKRRYVGDYTGLSAATTSRLHYDVVGTQLTQNLGSLIDPVYQEINMVLAEELSTCQINSFMPLNALELVLRLIAQPTSLIFVGAPLCRDAEWGKIMTEYAAMVRSTIKTFRGYPSFIHRFVAPFLSCVKQINSQLEALDLYVQPLIKERMANVGGRRKSSDLMQWLSDSAQGTDRDPKVLVRKLLLVNMAAIDTTSATLWHILMDLCAMPEYIAPLRQEIATVTSRGSLTLSSLNSMEKTDSFMKESQRINQIGLLTMNREVLRPFKLSDGVVLPPGSFVSMPLYSICHDSKYYEDPDSFQGLRFFERRQKDPSQSHRHQFSSISHDNMSFGAGKSTCPGRFWVSSIIKLVLISILSEYDIEFPSGQKERPKTLFYGERCVLDRTQNICFRKRENINAGLENPTTYFQPLDKL